MKVYGIIMEINPFHNGHLYFLEQARKIAKDDLLVCIISTNVVQRGEFSVLTKDIKTKQLLNNGVDIVCELPAVLANQGGQYFAKAALNILSEFKITNLIFGSETANLEHLLIASEKYQNGSFTTGINSTLGTLKSNDILGLSYIRAAKELKLNLTFNLVQRIHNQYNDLTLNGSIASASAIRANLSSPALIAGSLPSESLSNICHIDNHLLFNLFKVNLENCLDNQINIFLSENNQLLLRMQSILNEHPITDIDSLVLKCRDRNNSSYKYRRVIINVISMITDDNYNDWAYLRILGFNTNASHAIPKNSFTSLANQTSPICIIEKRVSKLFSLLTNNFQYNEYNRKPIIKKGD